MLKAPGVTGLRKPIEFFTFNPTRGSRRHCSKYQDGSTPSAPDVPLTNGPTFSQTMFVDADFSAPVARVGFNYKLGYAPAPAVYK
jgi:hypothetical protein